MHITTAISAVITLAGALVVLIWMPGRPSAQAEAARDVVPGEIPAAVAVEAGVES
jgi:hypothetical protein